ncbi:deoxyribose-phosphate aldolase [Corynebacterium hindlerae]|uniref:deoxyribose-phosphate aldolase n=1 Tax=Corynebacterium hindlerae TaxID=699041 RepID=UPI001AD6B3AE|nr:deoxyribose-phosphate aldolase [Corynebacterium hindlerae]QTH60118.1 deoxyribose-phosphate aldolase [Corynebacterium hindlerae]
MSHDLVPLLEYTLLDPLATTRDVAKLADDAHALRVPTICVPPHLLHAVAESELTVATVCGFPHGTHHPLIKATEARFAVQNGATHIDLVPNLGAISSGDMNQLLSEIVAVREAITDHVTLKVILETAAFPEEKIVMAAQIAEKAGADYVKTSTGFHPAGGATVEAVRLLAQTVRIPIKASGGVRTAEMSRELIAAGASRLGVSRPRDILA